MLEAVKEFWALIVAGVMLIMWVGRLEGRVKGNSKEIIRLEKRMEDDRADARAQRSETNDLLKEMRQDIKRLLERPGT